MIVEIKSVTCEMYNAQAYPSSGLFINSGNLIYVNKNNNVCLFLEMMQYSPLEEIDNSDKGNSISEDLLLKTIALLTDKGQINNLTKK